MFLGSTRSMATLAFLSFFDEAQGESIQKGKEKWIELRGWSWGVDADTSGTRGGGASLGGEHGPGKDFTRDVTTGAVSP
jgi:type VI protein secretion system component Hcp